MKRHWSLRSLALGAAFALCVPVAGLSEELGELDLFDPAIYVEDGLPIEESPAGELPAEEGFVGETVWEESAETSDGMPAEAFEPPAEAPVNGGAGQGAPGEETAPTAEQSEASGEQGPAMEQGAPGEETAPAADQSEASESEAGQPEVQGGSPEVTGSAGEASEEQVGESVESDLSEHAAEPEATSGEDGEQAIAAQGLEAEEDGEQAVAAAAASEPNVTLGAGEQYALNGAALLGGDAVAMYRSDRTEVATVDALSGLVTAVAPGTAVLTVTGEKGGTASFVVAVLNAPASLSFDAISLSMGKGERGLLVARLPENSAAYAIAYASSNPGVVAVDGAGNIRAKKTGNAVITATAYNGAKAACKVKVAKAPSKVTLSASKLVLNVGDERALKAKLPSKTASRIAWKSSNEAVVTVDASGKLKAVGAGTATVAASTFNGKKAGCKVAVVEGSAPTKLSLGFSTLSLGVKEKYQLTPVVGDGEGAMFAYASSKKAVASVSDKGVITAKKSGTAKITVTTHNGLKATLTVKVVKAPSKVALSHSALSLSVGQTAKLTAKLPAGTASAIAWRSSDDSVASVDASGQVTAHKAGTASIWAVTFNKKKSGLCTVTVTESAGGQPQPAAEEPREETTTVVSVSSMISNLHSSSALGGKRAAIASVVELLIKAGFEPAFAAGVGANVYSEGTYGMFESSKYISNYKKRPRYFCYLDGGDYYTSQSGDYALTAVYMSKEEMASYTGSAEARERFGEENFYLNNYSGKYVQNVNLTELEALMETLAAGGWEGKFGLGIVQWTGGRTKTLVSFYRKHAGAGAASITAEQVVAAENEMILYDLKGSYSGVYAAWKGANSALNTAEAARSAGSLVCTKYEIPANKESKAVTRGNKAAEIFNIMVGAD